MVACLFLLGSVSLFVSLLYNYIVIVLPFLLSYPFSALVFSDREGKRRGGRDLQEELDLFLLLVLPC